MSVKQDSVWLVETAQESKKALLRSYHDDLIRLAKNYAADVARTEQNILDAQDAIIEYGNALIKLKGAE